MTGKKGLAVKAGWAVLLFVLVLSIPGGGAGHAAPQAEIPQGIPAEVRQEIEKLSSGAPCDRGYAAYRLGMMGKEASPAVPVLIPLMDETAPSFRWQAGQYLYEPEDELQGYSTMAWEARRALIRIGGPAVEPLTAALTSENPGIRAGAARALGEIGDSRAVEPLMAALNANNDDYRNQGSITEALGKLGNPGAVEPLIASLAGSFPNVRSAVARALAEIGRPAATALVSALRHADPYIRENAAALLGEIGDRQTAGPLKPLLGDPEIGVRAEAAYALGLLGGPGVFDALRAALGDKSHYVRANAAQSLGKAGGGRAVESLRRALHDEYPLVRQNAAWALGELRDSRAVPPLRAALKDSFPAVRQNAAAALGSLKSADAVDALISALDDPHRGVREYAAWSLEDLTGESFGEERADWQAWRKQARQETGPLVGNSPR